MSSKVLFNTLTSGGVTYGRKQRSEDIERLQNFAHQYTQRFIADLLSKSARSTVGFDFVMTADGGNSRQVTVNNGRVYGIDGVQYATVGTTVIEFDAASGTTGQNRIDAIVAVVDDEVEADNAEIPVQRIRTQAELETAVAPYVPTQLSAYQNVENRATVMIKKGATSAIPVAPTVAGNEVLLYLVNVPGASVGIRTEDFTNARPDFRTQREQDEYIEQLRSDLEALILRVVRLEDIDTSPIDWGGELRSLREILMSMQNQLNALGRPPRGNDPRNTLPPDLSALSDAKQEKNQLIQLLLTTTDFVLLPDPSRAASLTFELTIQIAEEIGLWAPDSIHLAIAFDSRDCTMLITDDGDALDKIDSCQATFIQPFRQQQFSQLPVPPSFNAYGIANSTSFLHGSPGVSRLSALQALNGLGFV